MSDILSQNNSTNPRWLSSKNTRRPPLHLGRKHRWALSAVGAVKSGERSLIRPRIQSEEQPNKNLTLSLEVDNKWLSQRN